MTGVMGWRVMGVRVYSGAEATEGMTGNTPYQRGSLETIHLDFVISDPCNLFVVVLWFVASGTARRGMNDVTWYRVIGRCVCGM